MGGVLLIISPPSLTLVPTLLMSSGRSRISFLVSLPLETAILARLLPIRLLMSFIFRELIKGTLPYYPTAPSTNRKLMYIRGLVILRSITPKITIQQQKPQVESFPSTIPNAKFVIYPTSLILLSSRYYIVVRKTILLSFLILRGILISTIKIKRLTLLLIR